MQNKPQAWQGDDVVSFEIEVQYYDPYGPNTNRTWFYRFDEVRGGYVRDHWFRRCHFPHIQSLYVELAEGKTGQEASFARVLGATYEADSTFPDIATDLRWTDFDESYFINTEELGSWLSSGIVEARAIPDTVRHCPLFTSVQAGAMQLNRVQPFVERAERVVPLVTAGPFIYVIPYGFESRRADGERAWIARSCLSGSAQTNTVQANGTQLHLPIELSENAACAGTTAD